jgi:hypothetical protein
MHHGSFPSGGLALRSKRRKCRTLFLAAAGFAAILAPVIMAGLLVQSDGPRIASGNRASDRAPAHELAVAATRESDRWMLDPTLSLRPGAFGFAQNAPLGASFGSPSARPQPTVEPSLASAQQDDDPPQPSPPALASAQPAQAVPLPVPRPPELRAPKEPEQPQTATGPVSRRTRNAALPAAPEANRSFLEKLFGLKSTPSSALGYASLDGSVNVAPGSGLTPTPNPAAGEATAVYDISARVVTMPNGERLEAHSGLGDRLDDPRYVHVRMRGATPPGTYDLTERERLFHGVRALRLNPVGGSTAVHGRAGLLAHTYMLGPNGDSNGCVSFKNYDKFLQAYLRGEVKRLVVVTGRGQDLLPSIVNRIGARERIASNAGDT